MSLIFTTHRNRRYIIELRRTPRINYAKNVYLSGKETKAESYLFNLIRKYSDSNQPRLPTIRQMAAESGCSTVSLVQVLKKYSHAGIVKNVQKKGIVLLKTPSDDEISNPSSTVYKRNYHK